MLELKPILAVEVDGINVLSSLPCPYPHPSHTTWQYILPGKRQKILPYPLLSGLPHDLLGLMEC